VQLTQPRIFGDNLKQKRLMRALACDFLAHVFFTSLQNRYTFTTPESFLTGDKNLIQPKLIYMRQVRRGSGA